MSNTSARCTYFTTKVGAHYDYLVLFENTSPAPNAMYGWMFGAQFNVPLIPGAPPDFQNVVPMSSAPGWQLIPSSPTYGFIDGQTDYQGSAAGSGYITAGSIGAFEFRSSTGPPATVPFGCVFWNGVNAWGFPFNGKATHEQCVAQHVFSKYVKQVSPQHVAALPHGEMVGTKSVTLGGADGPSITVIHDQFGKVVKVVHEPPVPRKP